jgi:hypothetical protein
MRAAELLGCVVHDSEGVEIGHVHDLRFDSSPTPRSADPNDVTYRLAALECGSAAVGHRLGYGHGEMAGPWLLRSLFRRSLGSSLLVEWRDVARFERPHIYIGRRKAELSTAAETQS